MDKIIVLSKVVIWVIMVAIGYFMDAPHWAMAILSALSIYNIILFIFVFKLRK